MSELMCHRGQQYGAEGNAQPPQKGGRGCEVRLLLQYLPSSTVAPTRELAQTSRARRLVPGRNEECAAKGLVVRTGGAGTLPRDSSTPASFGMAGGRGTPPPPTPNLRRYATAPAPPRAAAS